LVAAPAHEWQTLLTVLKQIHQINCMVPVEKVWPSTSTKDELNVYLAQKALHHFEKRSETFIFNSRKDVFLNHLDVQHLRSSQEEDDTKKILHSIDAVQRGATEL
jgi:hypothetical protein